MSWQGREFLCYAAYASHGIDPEKGAVRLSFVHYTSRDEINQMLTALIKSSKFSVYWLLIGL